MMMRHTLPFLWTIATNLQIHLVKMKLCITRITTICQFSKVAYKVVYPLKRSWTQLKS